MCDRNGSDTIQSWLIRLIHCYSAANYSRFAELEVHPGQLPVLGKIHEREGISQRELAEALHIKPPTVAVTVKRMEKAGLIYRETDPRDMRVSRIYLSEKGKFFGEEVKRLLEETEESLTAGFSGEEKELLRTMLKRMVDNLR